MTKYTDRVDESVSISLHEYGGIRDPKTNKTVLMVYKYNNPNKKAVTIFISKEDVLEAIEEQDSGYFSYIDETYNEVIDNLNNDYLSFYITSLNDYNGWFVNDFYN